MIVVVTVSPKVAVKLIMTETFKCVKTCSHYHADCIIMYRYELQDVTNGTMRLVLGRIVHDSKEHLYVKAETSAEAISLHPGVFPISRGHFLEFHEYWICLESQSLLLNWMG